MSDAIFKAVDKLDPANDEHWTSDGSPKMAFLQEASGIADLTRAQFNEVVPNVTREALKAAQGGSEPPAPAASPTPPPAPDKKLSGDEPAEHPTIAETPEAKAKAALKELDDDQLVEQKQILSRRMNDIVEEIKQLNKERDQLLKAHDMIVLEEQVRTPAGTNDNAIREYIKRSREVRAASRTGMAPIDAHLQGRKRQRGLMPVGPRE